jgi:hypothetical protein
LDCAVSRPSGEARVLAAVEACVGDYRELEPRPGIIYFCFLDAASGSDGGDSYCIAIGHKDGDQVVIDCVREVIPPFSPAAVVTDVAVPLCKAYNSIDRVYGDNYAGEYAKEPFRKAGIFYDLWKQHKSEIYRDPLLPLINSKRITLPCNDRLINQTCTLERSVKRSGRDEITHPTHGHDDLINSAAGVAAVVLRRAAVWDEPGHVMPFVIGTPRNIPGSDLPLRYAHYLKQNQPAEPWRSLIGPDGTISTRGHGGKYWGPV